MAETEVKAHIGFEVDDAPLKKLHEGIASLKEGLLGLTATLVESGVALYETVVKTAEAGESAIKLGQQTGVGTVEIQRLGYAARATGIDAESLNTGLKFLNRNMFQVATGGGGLNDTFTKLGINIHKANGALRPANDVLGDIADKFKTLPDGPEKAGLAMKLFGRQGTSIIPILNKGKEGIKALGDEAQELGAVLSEDDAKKGMKFQESLKTLYAALEGIRNIVGTELLPVFTDIIKSITMWIKENRKLIVSGLGGFLKATATYLGALFKAFMAVANSIAGFVNVVGGAENATKLLLFTIGLLAGASVLFGIGKLVQGIIAAAEAFTIADAAALLIPIAIGLAIVAIGLLIEDLYTFMSGGDSLIGRLLAKIPEVAKAFSAIFQPVLDPIYAIIYGITSGLGTWGDAIKNLGVLVVNLLLLPFRTILEYVGASMSLLGRISGLKGLVSAGGAVQNAGGNLALDAVIPGSAPNQNTANNSNVNVNAPVTVTVPPNTPPGLVGDRVSEGVAQGVENHLRMAQRATQTAVAY